MLKIIKRIDVMSAAIMGAATAAALGLIAGLFIAAFGGAMSNFGNNSSFGNSGGFGSGLGIVAVVLFPVLYGFFGFIGGAIYAALYNLFAGMVGGIKVELE